MGGGLAFLNKKTWHPGSFRNQEEVWKREQQAAVEERKLEDLRKQLEDERKKQEFSQIAHDAGIVKCVRAGRGTPLPRLRPRAAAMLLPTRNVPSGSGAPVAPGGGRPQPSTHALQHPCSPSSPDLLSTPALVQEG
jgi:hypothetical protein